MCIFSLPIALNNAWKACLAFPLQVQIQAYFTVLHHNKVREALLAVLYKGAVHRWRLAVLRTSHCHCDVVLADLHKQCPLAATLSGLFPCKHFQWELPLAGSFRALLNVVRYCLCRVGWHGQCCWLVNMEVQSSHCVHCAGKCLRHCISIEIKLLEM